jgi:hypothetical protein
VSRGKRWAAAAAGLVVLAFGLGCLNYTRAEGLEHHRAVAARHGLPPPGPSIFFGGVTAVAAGAGLFGFAIGRGRMAS